MDDAPPPAPERREPWPLQFAAGTAIVLGLLGMLASAHFLSLADPRDIDAGSAGLIAGAILVGAGLIALALLFRRER